MDATFDASAFDAGPDGAAEAAPSEGGATDSETVDVATKEAGSVAESGAPEGSVVDAAADSGAEASAEASVDSGPDAAASCVTGLFGEHYVASDGTLYYAPSGSTHVQIKNGVTNQPLAPMLEVVQQVNDHACGLRGDGTVWCWPLTAGAGNTNGDLGSGAVGGSVPAVGTATQVVTNAAGTAFLTGVVHLSTASDTAYTFPTCAIRSDKTVWCWGYSTAPGNSGGLFQGSIGSGANVPYAIPIAAAASDGGPYPALTADQISVGGSFACALLAGKVSCWGTNTLGGLADGDMGLAFRPYPGPIVTGLGLPATVEAIGCGYNFACALAGGHVWCWGASGAGQVGNPSVPTQVCNLNYCQPAPVPVQASLPDGGQSQIDGGGSDQDPLANVTSLVVGYDFACALDSSGNVWCWGAKVVGSQYVLEATPLTSSIVPTTNVTRLTALGEDWSGIIYTTASGVYVNGGQATTPTCQ